MTQVERLLEEILAEVKMLNHSLGGAFLPWLPKIHAELRQQTMFLSNLAEILELVLAKEMEKEEEP